LEPLTAGGGIRLGFAFSSTIPGHVLREGFRVEGAGVERLTVIELLRLGALTVVPLGILSVVALGIVLERLWRYRGLSARTRELTRKVVASLSQRDVSAAAATCEATKTPMSACFQEALRWRNVALEDLDRILATSRAEAVAELRRGLWVLGTIGSLAPFIGLFGTVVGIMRAFQDMAVEGVGGFEVVAAGISEALVATAVGLLVAIVALAFYNWLQVRVGDIAGVFHRSSDRFVQALLYVEATGGTAPPSSGGSAPREVRGGNLQPA
jgi:biopolymer transport protein ExbB